MRHYALVALVSFIIYTPFIGSVRLFDWDEINFAECAREMIETGDYLHVKIDYQPFYEKPPLFIWAQVLSMQAFGINEFAARFPNVIVGVITMLVIVTIGKRLYDVKFGTLWALTYAGSLLPHFYFRSGIIDPLFNLFIFLSAYYVLKASDRRWFLNATLAAMSAAGAILTKGPVGLGLVGLTAIVAWNCVPLRNNLSRGSRFYSSLVTILYTAGVAVIISSVWYVIDYIQYGPTFVQQNIAYQLRLLTTSEAGHAQPFWYHAVVLLFGCFPASFLMFGGLKSTQVERDDQKIFRIWMIVLFLVVLVIFSIVKTKIIHYSSMTYLPLTFLAALSVYRWLNRERVMKWFQFWSVIIYGLIVSLLIGLGVYALIHKDWLLSLPTFKDRFLRSSLMQSVEWTGFELLIPMILFIGIILFALFKQRRKPMYSIVSLYLSVIVFTGVFLPVIGPRIERYTQGAAIDFYTSLVGVDCYVKPVTMKSYAHLFYTKKPFYLSAAAHGIEQGQWEPYLLNGPVTKPAFFVSKVNDAQQWREHPRLEVYKETGGFVIFKRINN